jgi:hypothetical protein
VHIQDAMVSVSHSTLVHILRTSALHRRSRHALKATKGDTPMRGGFGLLGLLGALLIALIAGGIGYMIGISADGAPVAPGTVAYGWGWGFPLFPFFGLLVGFLFILLIVSIARRSWGRPGWYGPGRRYGKYGSHDPADHASVPPPFQEMLDDWHRRAHDSPPPAGPAPTSRPPA